MTHPRSAALAALASAVAFLAGSGLASAGSPAPAVAAAPQAPPEFGPTAVYTIGFLKRGPKWTAERTEESAKIQANHMAHIRKMADEGLLVGAGPFADGGDLRGIFLFGQGKDEAARTHAAQDPAVLAGRLVLELHLWIGPAGLGDEYRQWAAQNPGTNPEMITLPFALLRRSPNAKPPSEQEKGRVMAGHLAHILEGARSGRLAAAGPLLDGGDVTGLLFYSPGTEEAQAKVHAEGDPAVQAGWFVPEFHPWMVAKGVLPTRWAVQAAAPK